MSRKLAFLIFCLALSQPTTSTQFLRKMATMIFPELPKKTAPAQPKPAIVRQSTLGGKGGFKNFVNVKDTFPDLIEAMDKVADSNLLHRRFMHSSLYINLQQVFGSGLQLMKEGPVPQAMEDFFVDFYTSTMYMLQNVQGFVETSGAKNRLVHHIPRDKWDAFVKSVDMGVRLCANLRALHLRSKAAGIFIDFVGELEMKTKVAFEVGPEVVREVTVYLMNGHDTITDSERNQRLKDLTRSLYFAMRIMDETYPFPIKVNPSVFYTRVLSACSMVTSLALLGPRAEDARNIEKLMVLITELYESACVKRSSFNPKKAFYTYLRSIYESLVNHINKFVLQESKPYKNAELENQMQIFREKLSELLDFMEEKVTVESETLVTENEASEGAATQLDPNADTSVPLGERQIKLLKRMLKARTASDSPIFNTPYAYLHMFTSATLNHAFELLERQPVSDEVVGQFEQFLDQALKIGETSKVVERETQPGEPVGVLLDAPSLKSMVREVVPQLVTSMATLEKVTKLVKDAPKALKLLDEDLKDLAVYVGSNVQYAGDKAIEYKNVSDDNSELLAKLAQGKVIEEEDRVVVRRNKRIQHIYLFEVIKCAGCTKDSAVKKLATSAN